MPVAVLKHSGRTGVSPSQCQRFKSSNCSWYWKRQITSEFLYNIGSRDQCCKTFYSRKLRNFVISLSICSWQAFPAQSTVCGQAHETTLQCTWVGFCLTFKHYTKLRILKRDKHFSLLQKNVTYGCKKSYNIGHRSCGLYYKTFRVVIYDRKLRSSLDRNLRSYSHNPSYGQVRLATAREGQERLAKAS